MLDKLGWRVSTSDTPVALGLRNELIDALGRFGDATTLKKSQELFNAERNGGPAIDPSLRPGVLTNVGRKADAGVYAELLKRLTTAHSVEDGWLYASALAHVEDPALAKAFLSLTLGDTVPTQIASWVPGMVADDCIHGTMTYAFVLDNFDAL
jgi:hypothetical protein